MNRTITILMLSDIFIVTGLGLIQPILSIYFNDNINGADIFTIGVASTLFLITKSIVQLPFSRYVDKGSDVRKWLLIGTILSGVIPFWYIFAKDITAIYAANILQGLGSGLAYPCWLGLWSAHLDKRHRSYEWSLYATTTGIGTAIAASVGGALAKFIGFEFTFILVGLFSVIGGLLLFGLDKKNDVRQLELSVFK